MDKPVFSASWECLLVLTFQTGELRHGVITATRPHLYHVSGKPGTAPGNSALRGVWSGSEGLALTLKSNKCVE